MLNFSIIISFSLATVAANSCPNTLPTICLALSKLFMDMERPSVTSALSTSTTCSSNHFAATAFGSSVNCTPVNFIAGFTASFASFVLFFALCFLSSALSASALSFASAALSAGASAGASAAGSAFSNAGSRPVNHSGAAVA